MISVEKGRTSTFTFTFQISMYGETIHAESLSKTFEVTKLRESGVVTEEVIKILNG